MDWTTLERVWMRTWERIGFSFPESFYHFRDIEVDRFPRYSFPEKDYMLDFWPVSQIPGRTEQLNGRGSYLYPFDHQGPVTDTLRVIDDSCPTKEEFSFCLLYCCLRQLERKGGWSAEIYSMQLELCELIEKEFPDFTHTWHSNAVNVLPEAVLNGSSYRNIISIKSSNDLLDLIALELAVLFTKWKLVRLVKS